MTEFTRAFSVPFRKSNYSKELYAMRKCFQDCDAYSGKENFSRMGDSIRTKDNLHTLRGFEYLTHWIEKEAFEFGKYTFGLTSTLSINSMWGTINSKTSHWNMVHTHPECLISGVFWLSTPIGSGDFVFMNPTNIDWWTQRLFNTEKLESNSYSGTYLKINAKEGQCLIFPSYVPHMVEPNTTEVNRISISFNIG